MSEGPHIGLGGRSSARRKTTDEELSADRARLFAGLFEHSPVGVCLMDARGGVIEANPSFMDIVGAGPGTLHMSLTDAVHSEDVKAVSRLLGEMHGGIVDKIQTEARFNRHGGISRWCRVSVSAWHEGNADSHFYVAALTDVTDLIQTQKELRALSMVDELTGLFNRRGFMTLGRKRLKHADRNGNGLLVLFADVDGMKWINDNLGHHMGDKALEEFSQVLNKTMRISDVAARIGGDEFAVITLDTTSAARVVDRIYKNIEARNAAAGREYLLSCCIGVTRYDPKRPCGIEELLKRADAKMYEQKQDREDSSFKAKPIQ
ncbi:MAG: diguanylate cyclase [Deltaproteobacteria bacterium]|nr:diguanylate cyclase [Deltaproteobacteria bacterium]